MIAVTYYIISIQTNNLRGLKDSDVHINVKCMIFETIISLPEISKKNASIFNIFHYMFLHLKCIVENKIL